MITLCIETSSSVAGTALFDDNKLIYESYMDLKLTHSQTLVPDIEKMLNACGILVGDIGRIIVDAGPGSYTGVRIGVCTANALGYALKCEINAVSSLSALSRNCINEFTCCLIDARGEQVYGGFFKKNQQRGELFAGAISDYLEKLPKDNTIVFVGDGAFAHRELIEKIFAEKALFMPPHLNKLRASSLYDAANEIEHCRQAVPLYMRPSQAERLRNG